MEATSRIWILVLACLLLPASGRAAEPDRSPWRLNDAVKVPPRLSIEGDQRTRYEYINGQFAAGFPGNQQVLDTGDEGLPPDLLQTINTRIV